MWLKIFGLTALLLGVLLKGSGEKSTFPIAYFLLMKDILTQSKAPMMRTLEEGEEKVAYGEEFLSLFQDSLQEGFFGGVKWGIAACFYQVLYELASGIISVIPASIRYIKYWSSGCIDTLCGRPSGIRTCDLSILAQLFYDIMHDFNTALSRDANVDTFRVDMIKKVCSHLITYLERHKKHYIDSSGEWTRVAYVIGDSPLYDKEDVSFIVTLLVQNLNCILERADIPALHEEIPQLTHITLRVFHTLGLLLQRGSGKLDDSGVFGAWFSGVERLQEKDNELCS